MQVTNSEWQVKTRELVEKMDLDWVEVIYSGTSWAGFRVVIAPWDNGKIPREDLLRKEIPYEFIVGIRKLFPRSVPLFVRGLVTQQEINEGLQTARSLGEMWSVGD